MMKDIIALGNKIEMQEIDLRMGGSEHEDRVYVSQLLEFDEEDSELLYIAMPIYEGRLIPLEVGRKFELSFYAKKGMYTCNSEIIRRFKTRNVYVLVVRVTSELKKNQRRQFYRLDINIEVFYKIFTNEDEKYFRAMRKISDEMIDRPFEKGMTIDVSGGGIRFISKDNIALGSKMMVRLPLELDTEIKDCNVIAKVISSIPSRGKERLYENRVEFVQINDSDRETLIKFIFKVERNIRKKQLE